MADPMLRFADVQKVLVDDLSRFDGVTGAGTETPADLAAHLPFVRVLRTGGGSSLFDDLPVVDIDVFDATYAAAEQLAERIRQYLVGPPPPIHLLDRVSCDAGPRELPWGDGTVRRLSATYSVICRRRWI